MKKSNLLDKVIDYLVKHAKAVSCVSSAVFLISLFYLLPNVLALKVIIWILLVLSALVLLAVATFLGRIHIPKWWKEITRKTVKVKVAIEDKEKPAPEKKEEEKQKEKPAVEQKVKEEPGAEKPPSKKPAPKSSTSKPK